MPHYRVYKLDDAGKFVGVRDIEAASDSAALEMVRQFPDDVGFEIWRGPHMVGQVGRDIVALTDVPGPVDH